MILHARNVQTFAILVIEIRFPAHSLYCPWAPGNHGNIGFSYMEGAGGCECKLSSDFFCHMEIAS